MPAAWPPPSRRRGGNARLACVGRPPEAMATAGAALQCAFVTPLVGSTSVVVATAAAAAAYPAPHGGDHWRQAAAARRAGRRASPLASAATALVREGAFVGTPSLSVAKRRACGGSATGASDSVTAASAAAAAATLASGGGVWGQAPPPVATPDSAAWASSGDGLSPSSTPPGVGGEGDRRRGGGLSRPGRGKGEGRRSRWRSAQPSGWNNGNNRNTRRSPERAPATRTTVNSDRGDGDSSRNGGGGRDSLRRGGSGASPRGKPPKVLSASDGVRSFNGRILAAARRGDLPAARHALADLDAALPGSRNVYTFNAMLLACVVARRPDAAAKVWAEFTVSADPASVADTDGGGGRGRGRGRGDDGVRGDDGPELFPLSPKHPPVIPNAVSYNTRLKLFLHPPDPAGAAALVAAMDGSSPARPLPDRVTYNTLLAAAVAAGDAPRATAAVAALHSSGLRGDTVTVTTLAKLLGWRKDLNGLGELLVAHVAEEYGKLTMTGITAIADAYVRAGRAGAAVALFSRLDGEGQFASVHVVSGGGLGTPPMAVAEGGDGSDRGGGTSGAGGGGGALLPSGVPLSLPLTPDLSTYNVWLKALREAPTGTISAGLDVVSRMKRAGVVPDYVTLLTLAGLCGRKGGAASAAGVLDAAVAMDTNEGKWGRGSVPLPAAWNPTTGQRRPAAAPAERTQAVPAARRDEGAPTSVGAAAARPSSRVGRPATMRVSVPPSAKASIATFNAVIRAHLARSPPDIPAATTLYARAVALSTTGGLAWYAPDGLTYTLLVDGAARAAAASPLGGEAAAAAVAVAEAVVADMEATAVAAAAGRDSGKASRVVPVDAMLPAYNALIKAHRHRGDDVDVTALADATLSRLARMGVSPDVVTFNSLLDVAASANRGPAAAKGLAVAVKLVREAMPASGVTPDRCTYNTLIKACGRAGVGAIRSQAAADGSGGGGNDGDSGGLSGGSGGWGASAATSTAALAIAHDALHQLRRAGLTPDDFTYHAMMGAAAAAGDATRALHYFRLAERERLMAIRAARGEDLAAPDRRDKDTRARDSRASAPHPSSYVAVMRALNRESGASAGGGVTDNSAGFGWGGGVGGGGRGGAGVAPVQPPSSFPAAAPRSLPGFPAGDAARGAPAVLRLRDEMLSRGVYVGRATNAAVADAVARVGDVATTEAALGAVLTAEARTAALAAARRLDGIGARGGGLDAVAAAGVAAVDSGEQEMRTPSSAFMRATLLGVPVDPPACLEGAGGGDVGGRVADEAGVADDGTSTLSPTAAAVTATAAATAPAAAADAAAAVATGTAVRSASAPSLALRGPTVRGKVIAADAAAAAAATDGAGEPPEMPLSARLDAHLSAVQVVTRLRAYLFAADGGVPAAERVLAATVAARRGDTAAATATAASADTDSDASTARTADAAGDGGAATTGYPPLDAAPFNVVIHAAVRAGDMDATLRVLRSMLAAGVSPTAATAAATRGVMRQLAATVGALDGRARRVLAAAAVAAVAKAGEAGAGGEEEVR